MEIKASCKLDRASVKALAHLSLYRKADPKKRLLFSLGLNTILLALAILDIKLFGPDPVFVVLLCVGIFLFVYRLFCHFIRPGINYKALANMQGTENLYIFCEDVLKTFSKSKDYTGEGTVEYTLFVKAYETSKYIFLFQTTNQVLVVDKSTIEGGTVMELRNKLTGFLKNKYIICKY